MGKDNVTGNILEIPPELLTNLEAIDTKINKIAEDSSKMSTSFGNAMGSMTTDTSTLLEKLQSIESVTKNLSDLKLGDIANLGKDLKDSSKGAEETSSRITEVTTSLNQMGKSKKNIAELTQEIKDLNDQLTKDEGVKPMSEQIRLVDKKRALEEELKWQKKSQDEKFDLIEKEREAVEKKNESQEKYERKKKESLEKEVAAYEKLQAAKQVDPEKDLADWLLSKKKEQLKAEEEIANRRKAAHDEQEKSLEEELSAIRNKEKFQKAEQDRLEKIAKEEDKRREAEAKSERERRKSNEDALKYAEQLAKKEAKIAEARHKAYRESVEGSIKIATSEETNTYAKRAKAIQNLEIAMRNLNESDKNYQKDLNRLVALHKRLTTQQEIVADKFGMTKEAQNKLLSTSDQLARKLALVFSVSQVQGYLKNIINITGEFEKQNVALASILQNKNQADKLFEQVTELAVKSPFQLKELITYTKSLSAYQVEYEKLFDTTKMLADVSAGLGVDMQRLILAFGQVKAANFLRGTEVRQFTEAGLNILGELSKYYSELEGRMVSVGEVQERVTKRMVAFGDVEEIFKRITSAGGIFYNMQEKQAETLAGQISNLSDSIDIMLNSIGQDNYGSIKLMVQLIRSMVDNFEIFANILKSSGWAFAVYAGKTFIAARANKAFAASSIEATAAQKGLVAMMAKSLMTIKNFGLFLKNNPYVWITAAIASATIATLDHIRAVNKNRKEYDVLVSSVNDYGKEVNDLLDKIKKQNVEIKKAESLISKSKVGTSEYAEAERKANDERKKQDYLLGELQKKHPDVYNGIVKQKNGVADLAEEQKRFNDELERTNYLNYLAKDQEGFFSDGLKENIKEAAISQKELTRETENLTGKYQDAYGRVKEFLSLNRNIPKEVGESLETINNSSDGIDVKIKEIFKLITNNREFFSNSLADVLDKINVAYYSYMKQSYEVKKNNEDLENNISDIVKRYELVYNTSTEEGKKAAKESVETFLEMIDIQDKKVRDFVAQQFEIKFKIKLELDKEKPIVLGEIEKGINDFLDEKGFSKISKIKAGQGISEYFKTLKDELKNLEEEYTKVTNASQQLNVGISNEDKAKELEKEIDAYKTTLKAYGELVEKEKEKSKENPELKKLKEQIELIKKVGQEYRKLQKYYSDDEAKQRVKDSFKDAFKEVGLSIDMDFDTQGIINGIENITNNAGEEGRKAITKAVSGLKAEVDIDVRKDNLNRLKGEIEDLFGSYELSMELDKSGLDKTSIEDMFHVDVFSLADVKKKLQEMKPLFYSQGEEYIKVWKNAEKKVSKMQDKEVQERMEKYLEYTNKMYSERARILIESEKAIGEARSLNLPKDEEKEIIDNIRKERDKKLSKNTWEDFKETELYIQMFENLEAKSDESIDNILNNLKQMRDSLKDLDPKDLKEIVNRMEQLEELKIQKNPFKGLKENIKEFIKYQKNAKKLNEEFARSSSLEIRLTTDVGNQEAEVALAKEKYRVAKDTYGEHSKEATLAKINLGRQKDLLDTTLKQLVAQGKITEELAKQIREGEKQEKSLSDRFSEASSGMSELANVDITGSLEQIFGNLSDGIKDGIETFQELMAGVSKMEDGISNILDGKVFSGTIKVFSGFMETLATPFRIGDKRKERAIKKQIILVEKLQESYEKLKEAIDNAYAIDELKKGTESMNANLKARNEALKEAIRKEDDKKKTDHERIKQWQKEIDANNKQIAENNKQLLRELGGFGNDQNIKSAAEQFAQSWLDAFLQTENGLQGLEDTMNEWLKNAVQKQLLVNLSKEFVTPLLNSFDEMFEAGSLGGANMLPEEAAAWKDLYESKSKEFNERAEAYLEALKAMGIDLGADKKEDELGGLQKGIQGVTEQTAEALEAITESIRFFSADSNMQLKQIANALTNPEFESPMISELRLQTEQLRLMYSLINSTTKTKAGQSGHIFKVEIV